MSDAAQGGQGPHPLPDEDSPTLIRSPHADDDTATWSTSAAAKQASPAMPEPGQVLAGRYTVLEQVGQGGMGLVLAAYDSRLDRRVALKLLRYRSGPGSSLGGEARLVREAQAMARLSHPHVVAVYDAGPLEDGSVFIAMEFVEGQTLRDWQESGPRPWREVLAMYLAAGRGLAAAHAAGLVHRDFKPENVLVGRDGRVRVTDFGLARADGASTPEAVPASALPPEALLGGSLTLPGALMGTPFYMAPELLEHGPADVRTDLYAFCVALYHALYRQPPFGGQGLVELVRSRREGPAAPPARTDVPPWVTRAVLRGLRAEPAERPESMAELLAALEDDPEQRRRTRRRSVALVATGVLLTGLAAWGWIRRGTPEPVCAGMQARLEGVWDDALRAQVRQSLLATGAPHAPDTAERVGAALDGYADRWVSQGTQVCEAVQGGASAPLGLMALREACLERRRARLRATTELLARGADRQMLDKAVQAVQSLPLLEDCADESALTAAVPPPEDPAMRAKVAALSESVDRVEALLETGQYRQGTEAGEALLEEVKATGHTPLHARLLLLVARLHSEAGDYKGSKAPAQEALAVASQARDLVLMARALSFHATQLSRHDARNQDAILLEPALDALAEATGDDATRAEVNHSLGGVLLELGRYEAAGVRFERALALRQKLFGPEHPSSADSLFRLGMVSWWQGRNEDALDKTERALALMQKALGPEHPEVARVLNIVGAVLKELGRLEEALERFEHILALRQKLLGPENPPVASALYNLSLGLYDLGRYEESLEAAGRSRVMREKVLGAQHSEVGSPMASMALSLMELGRHEEARILATQALELRERTLGPEHAHVSNMLEVLGSALTRLKRYPEAQSRLERSLAIAEKALGKEHPDTAYSLLRLGELWLARGRPAQALPYLERGLLRVPPSIRPNMRLRLAQALWEAHPAERARAVALAAEAREEWHRHRHPKEAEATRWLAAHPVP
jgi:serine/threonine-protein kinase